MYNIDNDNTNTTFIYHDIFVSKSFKSTLNLFLLDFFKIVCYECSHHETNPCRARTGS